MDNKTRINQDFSISIVRLMATIMIVACHMMQYEDFALAWWLNSGVQIFLCMSGYLYGCKELREGIVHFYMRQLKKILIDYYIVLIPVILLHIIFCKAGHSVLLIIKTLLTVGTLDGGGHLWYIPYILFCYLLTPFYARFFDWLATRNNSKIIPGGGIIAIMCTVQVLGSTCLRYFNPVWLNCFLAGFFIGSCERCGEQALKKWVIYAIYAAAFFMNGLQIYISYFSSYSFSGMLARFYALFCNYAHVALGCFLFFAMKRLFSHIFSKGYPEAVRKICRKTDQYSYDVYLTHQFFILGPFSMMRLTKSMLVNIMIIVACIIAAAVVVRKLSEYVISKIEDKERSIKNI